MYMILNLFLQKKMHKKHNIKKCVEESEVIIFFFKILKQIWFLGLENNL